MKQDPVTLFFSYSTSDSKDLTNFVAAWRRTLQPIGSRQTGEIGFRIYDYRSEQANPSGTEWKWNQDSALARADLLVAFVSTRYLTKDPRRQTFKELDFGIERWREGELDILPVTVDQPAKNVRHEEHWQVLRSLNPARLGGVSKVTDLKDPTALPEPLKKWFEHYILAQAEWIGGQRVGPRPHRSTVPAGDRHSVPLDGTLTIALRSRYARQELSPQTWSHIEESQAIAGFNGSLNESDPALNATLDQLIERVSRRAGEAAIASWIETYLP
ncbi:MAG: toll/interleukin-1 receptor domain-containing protein [Bifidobacteriaceae bacterium]|jgi:hypothetical protein|nr:toll/interleukin-1 receptor domain-containing protein [Bifidobacteriaceae bacterium]